MIRRYTIPPPPVDRERDTQPPSESDFPPPEFVTLADKHTQRLTAIEARLGRIEATLGDVTSETSGISKAFHEMRNAAVSIQDSLERLTRVYELISEQAESQNQSARRMRNDLDELEARVILLEAKQ